MEARFINNTELDVQKYLAFNKFHYLSRTSTKLFFSIYLLTGIFLLIASSTRLAQGDTFYLSNLFLALMLVALAFYPHIRVRWWFNRFIRTEKRLPMAIEYRFGSDSFEAKTSHSTEEVFYNQLYKIVETEQFYYFYINKINACIVEKNGFATGDTDGFTCFLRETAGKIYFDRTKRKSR